IAGSHVEEIQIRIVRHAIPDRTAAAQLPVLSIPRRRSLLHFIILEGFLRVAGYGIAAPFEFAGLGVVCGKETANRVFRTARSNDDLVLENAWGHRDRVVLLRRSSLNRPNGLSSGGIERRQPSVNDGNVYLAVINAEPAILVAAAQAPLNQGLIDL